VYLLVPPLRAARSFSDFQSGPITGFGLRGQVFKVVPPPLGYQLLRFKFSGPGGNRTHHTNLAKVGRLLGSCEPIAATLFFPAIESSKKAA